MSQSDEYRRFAQRCLEISETVQDERSRAVLIQMAQVWFRLAEEKEQRSAEERLLTLRLLSSLGQLRPCVFHLFQSSTMLFVRHFLCQTRALSCELAVFS
jgi:predicted component of type VI protein secretion system